MDERIRMSREQSRLDVLYKSLADEREESKIKVETERNLVELARENRKKVNIKICCLLYMTLTYC